MHLYRILSPKGLFGWCLLVVSAFMFWVAIGRNMLNLKGVLFLLALGAPPVVAAANLPFHWLDFWEHRHPLLRGFVLTFPTYVLIVTLGNRGELHSLRLWKEFLLPIGASPFTSVHAVAFAAAAYTLATQCYVLATPPPEDAERIVQGQAFITYDEAVRRSEALLNVEH